jgi:hypothetical protein
LDGSNEHIVVDTGFGHSDDRRCGLLRLKDDCFVPLGQRDAAVAVIHLRHQDVPGQSVTFAHESRPSAGSLHACLGAATLANKTCHTPINGKRGHVAIGFGILRHDRWHSGA